MIGLAALATAVVAGPMVGIVGSTITTATVSSIGGALVADAASGDGTACNVSVGSGGASGVTSVQSSKGETVNLDSKKQGYVNEIVAEGTRRNLTNEQIVIAIATALTETRLTNWANKHVPESLSIPNDGVAQDHDSVGVFQQRVIYWGKAKDLMNVTKSAGLFYDKLVPWMAAHPGATPGQAAQGVQQSGYPERYQLWMDAASSLAGSAGSTTSCTATADGAWIYPLASFAPASSSYNLARNNPAGGGVRPHWGTDIPAPNGTAVLAVADGTVKATGKNSGAGNYVIIDTADGWRVRYFHMQDGSVKVSTGQSVKQGQQVGKEGTTGHSTGPHLHVETSEIAKIGPVLFCAMNPAWKDRCVNPLETFAAHGVDLKTGAVTAVASKKSSGKGSTATGRKVLSFARSKVGGPYVWGGTGPIGYDCSGLAQAAYASAGISIPRSSQDQCSTGTPVPAGQEKAGDIVCYRRPSPHVDIYDGNGGVVGAFNTKRGIATDTLANKDRWWGGHYMVRFTK